MIAQPKTSGNSKALRPQRDGDKARANSKPEGAAKRVPVSECLGHQAHTTAHTKPPRTNINDRLGFPPQFEPEARPAKGREAGHRYWTKHTNITTHNRFEVLRMED